MLERRLLASIPTKMEDMAAMLNAMAGGLQQSFGTVFERVGQSLEQSAQVMQMMNAMMEAAMLQNLLVRYDVLSDIKGLSHFVLQVVVENRSQINITEATIGVRLSDAAETPKCDGNDDIRVLEQGLAANSTFETTFSLDPAVLGHEGTILLRVCSPGTHEWLEKKIPFRIPVFKLATVEAIGSTFVNREGFVQAHSDTISINFVREALGVSPFDALLTITAGYYRLCIPGGIFSPEEVEFAVQIQQTTESPSGVRVIVTTAAQPEAARNCRVLLKELELL